LLYLVECLVFVFRSFENYSSEFIIFNLDSSDRKAQELVNLGLLESRLSEQAALRWAQERNDGKIATQILSFSTLQERETSVRFQLFHLVFICHLSKVEFVL